MPLSHGGIFQPVRWGLHGHFSRRSASAWLRLGANPATYCAGLSGDGRLHGARHWRVPGLGGIAGLSLLLPFMFGMDPILGLALMIGMVAVVPTSDTFASVLMGIPGSSASQATVLDGFPMAKKGQAARALSAAFASSLFGGWWGRRF